MKKKPTLTVAAFRKLAVFPNVGSVVPIFCGVTEDGYNTMVAGHNDVARPATVMGVRFQFGQWDDDCHRLDSPPQVLIRVRFLKPLPVNTNNHAPRDRTEEVHVSCWSKLSLASHKQRKRDEQRRLRIASRTALKGTV